MVVILDKLSPLDVTDRIGSFRQQYVQDWKGWIELSDCLDDPNTTSVPIAVAEKFHDVLWSWRACGRSQYPKDATDLLGTLNRALPFLHALGISDLRSFAFPADLLKQLINNLWIIFRAGICKEGIAWEVAITKAILLTTRGRIGPAFDSKVQTAIGIDYILDSESLISVQSQIAKQIAAFEERHGVKIEELVPPDRRPVAVGRAVDMLLHATRPRRSRIEL